MSSANVVREGRPGAVRPDRPAPHFVTNGAELGLDLDAYPSSDAVLTARDRANNRVRTFLAGIDPSDLERACAPLGGEFSVLGAVQNVIFEEWAHHEYVVRDLAVLERAG